MLICRFWVSIVKDNENWPLVLKNSARRGFLALGSNGKTYSWPKGRKTLDHPDLDHFQKLFEIVEFLYGYQSHRYISF
jgi:hypothetical protein